MPFKKNIYVLWLKISGQKLSFLEDRSLLYEVFGKSADFIKFLEAYEGKRKEILVSKMWWGKRGLNDVILQATNICMCRVQMPYVAWYTKMQQFI